MQDTILNAISMPDTLPGIALKDSLLIYHDSSVIIKPPGLPGKEIIPRKLRYDSLKLALKKSDGISGFKEKETSNQDSVLIYGQKISIVPHNDSFFSRNINTERLPDWYFIIIISILIILAWIRIIYDRILTSLFEITYNFQLASKLQLERSIIQKRIGYVLDLIYFVNGSLFLIILTRFFNWSLLNTNDFATFLIWLGFLFSLMLIRVIIMSLTGFIFDRYMLFSRFLYHYFIYSKVLGLALLPFVLTIPYTNSPLHEILIYTALILTGIVYLMRIFRAVIYTIKNVILIFYLILYLCTLEILPVFVIIKIINSLK